MMLQMVEKCLVDSMRLSSGRRSNVSQYFSITCVVGFSWDVWVFCDGRREGSIGDSGRFGGEFSGCFVGGWGVVWVFYDGVLMGVSWSL